MKKNGSKARILIFSLCLFITYSFAGGYQINELGARAAGMGGAFVARASNGSGIFFNPAGLAFQNGLKLSIGSTFISSITSFTGPAPLTTITSMRNHTFATQHLYVSTSIGDKWGFGIGLFTPYGFHSEWPNEWSGRRVVVSAYLRTYYLNPTFAFKVNDQIALGAGVSAVLGTFNLGYRVPTFTALEPPIPSDEDGLASVDTKGNGISYTVGLLFKPTKKISIGVSYRSLLKINFAGKVFFTNMSALKSYYPDGVTSITIPMPSNLYLGAAYEFNHRFVLEGDIQWVDWKIYKQFQTLRSNISPFPFNSSQQRPDEQIKNWDNGFLFRIGVEYRINEDITLRTGYVKDFCPQQETQIDPMLPDANRNDFSIGSGFQFSEGVHVDLYFLLIMFNHRDALFSYIPGTYKNTQNLFGFDFDFQL